MTTKFKKIDDRTMEVSEDKTTTETKRWCLNEINSEIASLQEQKTSADERITELQTFLSEAQKLELVE